MNIKVGNKLPRLSDTNNNIVIEREGVFNIENKSIHYAVCFNLEHGNRMGYLILPYKSYDNIKNDTYDILPDRDITFFDVTDNHPYKLIKQHTVIGFDTGHTTDLIDFISWKYYLDVFLNEIGMENYLFTAVHVEDMVKLEKHLNKSFLWTQFAIENELYKLAEEIWIYL
jgi:hypothetical protein